MALCLKILTGNYVVFKLQQVAHGVETQQVIACAMGNMNGKAILISPPCL